jgi:hypothetical protein
MFLKVVYDGVMDKEESCCGSNKCCGSNPHGFLGKVMMLVMLVVFVFLAWHGYRGAKRVVNGTLRHQEYLRLNLAVDGCNKTSMYEFVDAKKGVKTQAPMRDVFIKCMEDKGYLEYRDLGKPVESEVTPS